MGGAIVFFQLCDLISNLALPVIFFCVGVVVVVVCGLLKVGVGSGELSADVWFI